MSHITIIGSFSLLLLLCNGISSTSASNQPQQIHLSFGTALDEMVVTWLTMRPTAHAHVLYGPVGKPMNLVATANSSMYENPGTEGRLVYIHRAWLHDLIPSTRYTYQVMSRRSAATPMFFNSRSLPFKPSSLVNSNKKSRSNQLSGIPATSKLPITPGTFAMYADMGTNTTLIEKLAAQAQRGDYLAILHGGDIAYDLHKKNGRIGDEFLRQIQPLAGYVPYQVAAGNHERKANFSQYQARFSMQDQQTGRQNNHYYSFDEHLVHFIVYSTEFYYYPEFGTEQLQSQYNWLKEDLRRANLPENRSKRPWIVAMAHRSMYCAGFDRKDCVHDQRVFRMHTKYPLEQLFQAYGVDLHLAGHEHAYVRMLPVYEKRVFSGSVSELSAIESIDKIKLPDLAKQSKNLTEEQAKDFAFNKESGDEDEFDLDDNQQDQLSELRKFFALDREVSTTRASSALYHDPPVMVNLLSGSSSNVQRERAPPTLAPRWVSKWSLEASYTKFTVYNSSYIHIQQLTGAPEGQDLLDEIHLIKNSHGPVYQDLSALPSISDEDNE